MHRDEISVHREDVGNQHTGRRLLLVTLERRCPLDRNRFAACDIQEELRAILSKRKRRLGSVFISMNTDGESFRQDQVHEAKRIRQWRWQVLPCTNAGIQKLKFQKGDVRQAAIS